MVTTHKTHLPYNNVSDASGLLCCCTICAIHAIHAILTSYDYYIKGVFICYTM